MMDESINTLTKIISDDLGACIARDDIKAFDTLYDVWNQMPIGRSGDSGASMWWWIDAFVQSKEERFRIARGIFAVDLFFANLGKLGGSYIPSKLKEALKRQILLAMFPTGREVILQATSVPARLAQKHLLSYIEAEQWRMR